MLWAMRLGLASQNFKKKRAKGHVYRRLPVTQLLTDPFAVRTIARQQRPADCCFRKLRRTDHPLLAELPCRKLQKQNWAITTSVKVVSAAEKQLWKFPSTFTRWFICFVTPVCSGSTSTQHVAAFVEHDALSTRTSLLLLRQLLSVLRRFLCLRGVA